MRRLLAALAIALVAVGVRPLLPGWPHPVVLAHAQLVSSDPGSGEVVATAPPELRLVFSEPLDPRYSFAEVLRSDGRVIVPRTATMDPSDVRVLVVPLPRLADGAYTATWQTVSAADGHQATGFVTFGVGAVDPDVLGAAPADQAGHLHGGHDAFTGLLEVQARTLADLGVLLAFGLLVVALAVLRPALGVAREVGTAQGWLLLAGAAGAGLLGLVTASAPGLDAGGYLTGTRPGQLLLARAALGVAGALVAFGLARAARPVAAAVAGGLAGLAGIGLLAASGHASAAGAVAPVAAMAVHLAAGGTWLAGLAALGVLALARRDGAWRREAVPRFSAVALVSVALVALTGVGQAFAQAGDPLSLATPYHVALWIKVGLVVAALALGAANYVTAGEPRRGAGTFRRRIVLEAALGLGVLIATANLASGSPPASVATVELAPAAASGGAGAALAVRPGRPGPNGVVATWDWGTDPAAAGGTLELRLDRLDGSAGGTVVRLRAAGPDRFVADGLLLPPGSAWDATLVARRADGVELRRARFGFALDAAGVTTGRRASLLAPGPVIGGLLLLAGLLAGATLLAGGSLPRTERTAGRRALAAGAAVALPLGALLLLAGGGS